MLDSLECIFCGKKKNGENNIDYFFLFLFLLFL
jgi:hypothetical protein